MRTVRLSVLALALTALSVVLAPPASSGAASSLVVSGQAQCISDTQVQVTWNVLNNDIEELDIEILGGIVISHGDLPVTLGPSIIAFGESATGQSTLPAGPGTAILEVHYLFFFGGGGDAAPRQSFLTAQGSVELPDCTPPSTTVTTTTMPQSTTTVEQTTTTPPPPPRHQERVWGAVVRSTLRRCDHSRGRSSWSLAQGRASAVHRQSASLARERTSSRSIWARTARWPRRMTSLAQRSRATWHRRLRGVGCGRRSTSWAASM
jgi:hypothetical protein